MICPALANNVWIEYRVDTTYDNYLNNWYDDMNFMCEDKQKIDTINSVFFAGFAIGGGVLSSFPDRIGRKTSMLISGSLHLLTQYIIMFSHVYQTRVIGFFLLGFFQIKNGVSIMWTIELLENRHRNDVICWLNGFDGFTLAMTAFWLVFINKSWWSFFLSFTLLSTVSFVVLMMFAPESPKWLLILDRKEEAIKAFNQIGHINHSQVTIPDHQEFHE